MTTAKPKCGALAPVAWALGALLIGCAPSAASAPETPQIMVDQFGWRPAATKVAIFADPRRGQNANRSFVPGATFEVRPAAGGRAVLRGRLRQWRNGEIDEVSGDRVWWADLSRLRTPGRYVVFDPKNNVQSAPFTIAEDVYLSVLRASMRTFYYQRCGVAIEARYGGSWNRSVCHTAQRQARALVADEPRGPLRDVSGGWHDAGDHNKYVPFLSTVLWDLLVAYGRNPAAFGDDYGIPESGNGIPDVLDEVKWELDWLLKMQADDGGFHNRVISRSHETGPGPHLDPQEYFYTPVTTWATSTAVLSLAHAARTFRALEGRLPGYAARLQAAAERGWGYLARHPSMHPADGLDGAGRTASAAASSDATTDLYLRVLAAAEMWKTTGNPVYRAYFEANCKRRAPGDTTTHHPLLNGSIDPLNGDEITRAFVIYATTPGHDARLAREFREVLARSLRENYLLRTDDDPYRAWMFPGHYCWGSNRVKMRWAQILIFAAMLEASPRRRARYLAIAEEFVHYIHGRNPLSLVYLTNMGARGARLGASRSVMEMFHGWFQDGSPLYDGPGSRYGPAPGFLTGGPNRFFDKPFVAPPYGEPPAKAFREWNTSWNAQHQSTEDPWTINEPAIYYQAAYTMVLAEFVRRPTPGPRAGGGSGARRGPAAGRVTR
ncbi:MAG TPA: glycoside hydrolase family 9 protein [Chthonomonadales bacterium]|nr:glycoside hydrolase family 9 protein [Chthonomonadales bacterium]